MSGSQAARLGAMALGQAFRQASAAAPSAAAGLPRGLLARFSGTGSLRGMSAAAEGAAAAAAPKAPPPPPPKGSSVPQILILGGMAAGGVFAYSLFTSGSAGQQGGIPKLSAETKKDYAAVKKAIADVLDAPDYDDGSYGPVLVRLAWHAAGTYDKNSGTGGSDGATMRFSPECAHGANAGLKVARELLEPIKKKFPWISYADLWTLAGCTAIEEMGGPAIPWRAGRVDKPDGSHCPPEGRLPDASKGPPHIREIFYRMGFDDKEIVALVGAHTLGRCHTDRSGFDGPWTNAPTTFSNLYYQELANNRWRKKKWSGPEQYEDKSGKLMMLPGDMALLWDRGFKKYVNQYAKDEEAFFKDFAAAFAKLMELGVKFPEGAKPI